MDNGLIFPYHLVALERGVTQQDRSAWPFGDARCKPVGGSGRQIRRSINSEKRMRVPIRRDGSDRVHTAKKNLGREPFK